MVVHMRSSTSVQSPTKYFLTALVMSNASLLCGICSGRDKPHGGNAWSLKKQRNESRRLRDRITSPTAVTGRWLRGAQTRTGLWISGITCLLRGITSMRILIRRMVRPTAISSMIRGIMILKTGLGCHGKGLRLDSGCYCRGRMMRTLQLLQGLGSMYLNIMLVFTGISMLSIPA